MARQFDAGSKYLLGTPSFALPTTGTYSVWLYPLNAQGDSGQHLYLVAGHRTGGWYAFGIWKWNDNKLYVGFYNNNSPDSRIVLNAGTYTLAQNTWTNLTYTWISGGYSYLYLAGSQVGSNSSTTIFTAPTEINFGGRDLDGTVYSANARIARFAAWSRVLSSDEIASLAAGVNPALFSDKLRVYYPIFGIHDPEPDMVSFRTDTLTLYGSPASADDPPIGFGSNLIGLGPSEVGTSLAAQFTAQAIYSADANPAVSQFTAQAIYSGDANPRIGTFIVQAIVPPGWTYEETGNLILDGATESQFIPAPEITNWEYEETGNIIIDATTEVVKEWTRADAGDVIIDGETIADPLIPVDGVVTQVVAEILTTPNAEGEVTQVVAEILALQNSELEVSQTIAEILQRANAEIEVEQAVCEVLIVCQYRPDFMPTLQHFMG